MTLPSSTTRAQFVGAYVELLRVSEDFAGRVYDCLTQDDQDLMAPFQDEVENVVRHIESKARQSHDRVR